MRSICIRVRAREHLLVLNFHHAVFDAWSLGLLLRELNEFYTDDRAPSKAPFQYSDYIAWQSEWLAGAEAARQRAYWSEQLAGELPPLRLKQESMRREAGPRGRLQELRFDSELCRAIGRLAQEQATTPFVVVLAAFFATLHRQAGQDQIVVGVPVAGRCFSESDTIVGCLTNTVALRMQFRDGIRFVDLAAETSRLLGEALSNQELPFDHVVDAIAAPRSSKVNPVFQAMFVMQSTPRDAELKLDGMETDEIIIHSGNVFLVVLSCRPELAATACR
jgi:hypothetical protein